MGKVRMGARFSPQGEVKVRMRKVKVIMGKVKLRTLKSGRRHSHLR